jgi:hypothetical protein
MKHLKYLSYVLRHKWFVFLECANRGLIWRGAIHDWSKFLPSEFLPYADYFYGHDSVNSGRDDTGYYKPTDTGNAAFDFAWLLHQKRNDHHWQWWILPEDDGGIKVLPMSASARIEMVCDWKGAGKAQGKPNTADWYEKNKGKMQLHPETRAWIEGQLKNK